MPTIPERYRDRISIDPAPNGCWVWTGSRLPSGYGRLSIKNQAHYAHRFMWELWNGRPIPEGLSIDHLCRNPPCCNPAHLEPVTPSVNTRRSPIHPSVVLAARTHCIHGHEFTKANTAWSGTKRRCRRCDSDRSLARYYRNKAARIRAENEAVRACVNTPDPATPELTGDDDARR